MKKMIRFTVLLLLMAGVFVFSSGDPIKAATDNYHWIYSLLSRI